jgi:uncharacterized protein (TIGR01244 family)
MHQRLTILAAAGLAALLAGCSGAPAPAVRPPAAAGPLAAAPDTVADYPGFSGRLYRDGRVFVAGQPDSAAAAALPGRGVACVVNLRTPSEMGNRDRVPYDEAALLDGMQVDYVHVPLGGDDHPYTTAAVDSFAAALGRHEGPVLLHCASGGRAAYLWVAYLVRHEGMDFDEALARGRALGIRESPLDGLLGRRTKLVLVDE